MQRLRGAQINGRELFGIRRPKSDRQKKECDHSWESSSGKLLRQRLEHQYH